MQCSSRSSTISSCTQYLLSQLVTCKRRHPSYLRNAYLMTIVCSRHISSRELCQALATGSIAAPIQLKMQASPRHSSFFFYASAACNADQPPAQACEGASFTFLRGIQTLVANSSSVAHSGLFKTLVAPPLLLPTLFPQAVTVVGPGATLMGLLDGLAASSPFQEKRELYVERIESLTSYLSAATRQDIGAEVAEELLLACFTWQAFCLAAFVAATNKQDPIALAFLAHYYAAVELIIRVVKNKFWWWQNRPRHMVKLIGQSIDLAWVAWVAWPMEVIQMLGR
ncbi:hypothetical protein B0T26DRAFT_364509 [Lasiosphaeria miniovina]|uniref:Uncharacterized protein n=1 Tax=Lasiosphaeria miniovina TaxID=1954250 RepID=A0AA40ACN0_9PEZI|nr:uncharacterized protein B0T26DRAFT_364509 [Lasiosphaeria miniovina]KAK0713429.1 hypothetical protein B0T26DRAFT_364509 [Lasiosphaeria miniovina]